MNIKFIVENLLHRHKFVSLYLFKPSHGYSKYDALAVCQCRKIKRIAILSEITNINMVEHVKEDKPHLYLVKK